MGRRRKAGIISFFVALAVLAGTGVYFHAHGIGEQEAVADTSYFVEADGSIAIPPGGISTEARMTRGNSEENPFFALEIVPYEGYAEFGYLIEGCEPIDFSVYSNRGNLPYYHRKQVIYSMDDIPRLMPEYEVGKEVRDSYVEQFGVMTRVEAGTGTYRQIPTESEYILGGAGGYSKATQYNSGQIDGNGETKYYGDTNGLFITFEYAPEATGVMKYSPVINDKLSTSQYYMYYSMVNGHWVYTAAGTNSYTPAFYVGTGTHHVVFVPDENGEYIVERTLGSATEGMLKYIIDQDPSLGWGVLDPGKRQSGLYAKGEGYIPDAEGIYTRKVLKAKYEKVVTGSEGADFTYEPLSYEECKNMPEATKASYRNALPEGTEFKVARQNVTYYTGYVHDNTFLRETLDLGYEMIDGVRTKITDEKRVEDRIADYHAVVYTVTPEDLNQNPELVDRADMISISATNKVGATIEMYRECKRADLFSRADTPAAKAVKNFYINENNKATFSTNQLDWDVVLRIYKRVTEDECTCPMIIDTVAYKSVGSGGTVAGQKANVSIPQTYGDGSVRYENGTGYSNNLYKLFLLLDQMKAEVFTSLYGPLTGPNFAVVNTGETEKDGSPIQTCIFTKWNLPDSAPTAQKNATKYWNEWTFLPYELMPAYGQHKDVVDSLGIMNSYGDTIYHFDSQGAQNMMMGNLYVFPTNNLMTIDFSNMDASGLQNNQYGHEAYEYFDSVNGEEGVPDNLGTARSIHYLWKKAQGGANPSGVKQFRVLELEPSSRYLKSDVAWDSFFTNYCENQADVTVDRMTTSEFNGVRVDLLSEYDLIYVGVNKDSSDVTMQFGGGPDYLYAHTGPGITLNNGELLGLLGQSSVENRFVFSGNDLTKRAKEQLLSYAKEGSPILFGTGFYTGPDAGSAVAGIDRNSNVYALSAEVKALPQAAKVHLYEGALSGGVSYHLAESEKLKEALEKERITLTVQEQPVEYDSAKTQYSQKYITSGVLRYRFCVNGDPADDFEVCLWTDLNRDGAFSAEELAETEIYPMDEFGVQGAKLTGTQISGGTTYLVKSPLPEMTGGIHWKLAVMKNHAVQASLSGVSAVRAGSREEIRVLQIVPEVPSSRMLYLPQEGEVVGSTVQIPGLTTTQKQGTKLIWDYAEALTEYKLRFVRMTEQEAAHIHAGNPNSLSGQFDILVLGFTDSYTGTHGAMIQAAAEKFLQVGKSVVYTPDVLSLPGQDTATGGYAKRLRKRFGADRYGITAATSGGKAAELIAAYTGGTNSDIPKAPNSSGATGYVSVTAGGTEYLLAQGLSNAVLYRYRSGMAGNVTTTKVAKLNKGLITEYPYTCGEVLTVSDTHALPYQLDLEKETPVVWYCMTESGAGTASDGYLKKSEKDARNHSYVYSIGNIVYAGIGSTGSLTTDETKLFLNSLVAAYRETPDSARILIENTDAAKVGDTYYLCVDVDSGQKDKLMGADCASSYFVRESGHLVEKTGESKKLYFRIKDENILPVGTTAEYSLKFETEAGGSYTGTEYAVYDMTGALVTDLQANTPYYTFVKVTTESTASGPAIGQTLLLIHVKLRCFEGSLETYSCEDTKKVQIIPRGLFDLD